MQDDFSTAPIEPSDSARIQKQEMEEAQKTALAQEASQIAMTEFAEEAAFNPIMMSRRYKTLEERMRKKAEEKKNVEKTEAKVDEIEKADELAQRYQKRNSEMQSRSLLALHSRIKAGDTPEDILRKVMQNYPDHSLADEALDYLSETTSGDLREKIAAAKENLNKTYGREVAAGRNMGAQSREFSKDLGSPTALRDLYRDITGNPREATSLFDELYQTFSYDKLKLAINFLLHSLGADLKAKGPSIPHGELHRLTAEARNLLAILWVYRFFKGRMNLIRDAFERDGMLLPTRITFELLAKLFVQIMRERYPSMEKVLQLARQLGVTDETLAQIILFTQMRDAVRGVAPRLFRSNQHRHDVLMSFIEALEELEEELEGTEKEEEEDEEEEE